MNWLNGPYNAKIAAQQLRAIATAIDDGAGRNAIVKRLLNLIAWILPTRYRE